MKIQMTKYITIQILDNEQTKTKKIDWDHCICCCVFEIF
jgi:hypothetical protein